MNQIIALTFAVFVGMVVGTLPGIRETTPWGMPKPPPPEPVVIYVTPTPAPVVHQPPATPKPGAWMFDRQTALDRGAHSRTTGPGAAVIYNRYVTSTPIPSR